MQEGGGMGEGVEGGGACVACGRGRGASYNQTAHCKIYKSLHKIYKSLTSTTKEEEAQWKLPDLKPEQIYSKRAYRRYISLANKSIARIPAREGVYFINISQLWKGARKKALRKGFDYVHLGCVQVGVNPLFIAGPHVSASIMLLDRRMSNFKDQFLGGIEAPLSHGPMYLQVRPNYSICSTDLCFITLCVKIEGHSAENDTPNIVEVAYSLISASLLLPPTEIIVKGDDHSQIVTCDMLQ